MEVIYLAAIKKENDGYFVYIPDLDGCTEGNSFTDAVKMARDYISLYCMEKEDQGEEIPPRSSDEKARRDALDNPYDINLEGCIFTYVDADITAYRKMLSNKAMHKNVTIPMWLNDKAEREGVNFSKVLQDALIKIVGERH